MPESESTENSAAERRSQWRKFHRGPGVVVVFILVVVVVLGFGIFIGSAAHMNVNRQVSSRFSINRPGLSFSVGGGGVSSASGQTLANQNQIEGVVTAVNGSSLTVAGDGTTNTVQTNSSTAYIDGSAPVVNDTVIVDGTISNNTFTATKVDINPAQ